MSDRKAPPKTGGVYLAGSSLDMDRARKWHGRLTEAGVWVCSTWIENISRVGQPNPRDASAQDRRKWATGCLNEVSKAAVMWSLVPDGDRPLHTKGKWAELGYAYGIAIPIVCSGDTKSSIFCALGYEYASDEDAFAHVVAIAKEHCR